MRLRIVVAFLMLIAQIWAQVPASCPSNRPVDDLILMQLMLHSKKNNRNRDPMPEKLCIEGWCVKPGPTPKTLPQAMPEETAPGSKAAPLTDAEIRTCQYNFEDALRAAHNVEVADYSMDTRNYRAARDRYAEALTEKPSDAAIHVRLARASEKLGETKAARENYEAAVKLGVPQKWVDEARAALERMGKDSTGK